MYKVLLVDDENRVLKSLENGVDWEKSGVCVAGKANNADQALQLVQEIKPHIVFTDIRMPGLSGLDLIEKIQEIDPKIQFVIISGYADFSYAQRSIMYRVLGYCLKPFDEDEIAELLQKAIEILNKDNTATSMLQDTKNNSLQQILKFVDDNYMSDITIQELAKRYYLNPNYLSQLFKRELGLTFTEYLTAARMRTAQDLLHTTTLSIREISENIGFKDYFYFIRRFKKETQKTPGQFRKEHYRHG